MIALLISFALKAANFALGHRRREGVWPAEGTAEAKAGGDQPGKQRVGGFLCPLNVHVTAELAEGGGGDLDEGIHLTRRWPFSRWAPQREGVYGAGVRLGTGAN